MEKKEYCWVCHCGIWLLFTDCSLLARSIAFLGTDAGEICFYNSSYVFLVSINWRQAVFNRISFPKCLDTILIPKFHWLIFYVVWVVIQYYGTISCFILNICLDVKMGNFSKTIFDCFLTCFHCFKMAGFPEKRIDHLIVFEKWVNLNEFLLFEEKRKHFKIITIT